MHDEDPVADWKVIAAYEQMMDFNKWSPQIPNINFHEEWDVKIIPPFGGALIRFRVNERVSVYLDVHERLGYYGGDPYWEVHPVDNDVARCDMKDVDRLMSHIEQALKETDEDDGLITVT